MAIITEYPAFFTATVLNWHKLLHQDKYKEIIIGSLRFLVQKQRIKLNAFVIMPNHLHLIWQMKNNCFRDDVQRDFLKFTAQCVKYDLEKFHPDQLEYFRIDAADRKHQIWERRPLSVELRTDKVYQQKLVYIHMNPVKAGLCVFPEEYKYSSAAFYYTGVDNWGFLTHYRD